MIKKNESMHDEETKWMSSKYTFLRAYKVNLYLYVDISIQKKKINILFFSF